MIPEFHLFVNGVAYSGESATESEPAAARSFASGWSGCAPATRDKLIFGQRPRVLCGARGVNSVIERILTRMSDGTLEVNTIEIRRINAH